MTQHRTPPDADDPADVADQPEPAGGDVTAASATPSVDIPEALEPTASEPVDQPHAPRVSQARVLRKAIGRLTKSSAFVLTIAAIPAVLTLVVTDGVLELIEADAWLRALVLALVGGVLLAVIIHATIVRSGVRLKVRNGRVVVRLKHWI